MSNTIVGLDFGHGVIRAAEVSHSADRDPVLHRYHEVQVPVDAIRDGVVTDAEPVVAALAWLWKVAGFGTKRVVIGMGSQQVLIREVTLPRMPKAQLRQTLPYRVQEMLPLPVDQAVLDFYGIEEVELEGEPHIRGLLVAATRESVLANTRVLEQAGLKAVDVDLIPFAIIRSHVEQERAGVKVYLHVGAVSTSVIVAVDGVPQFVRVLPAGGTDVTTALVERMSVRADRADELKRRFGLMADAADLDSRAVATITAEVARDMVQAVRSTVTFYENTRPESKVQGIVLSGGGAMLRGFEQELAKATNLPVTVSRPDGRVSIGSKVDEATFLASGTVPMVALGLTIRSAA